MLPSSLFDWWFAPWTYAVDPILRLPLAQDRLGQRDGYRVWCDQAQVAQDFPAQFHVAWHVAAISDSAELVATARLFGGLFAARQHDQALLGLLTIEDRKWCLAIAATQPLQHCTRARYAADDGIDVLGLVELARWLDSGFPGLWSRLRLLLSSTTSLQVDRRLREADKPAIEPNSALLRAQRCWRLCRSRVEASRSHAQNTDYAEHNGRASIRTAAMAMAAL
ncbi:MAG: hypothetical protein H7315_13400 [Herminiimonas sp.]|nr:hypothetical protein [Herminiimonas sp.]